MMNLYMYISSDMMKTPQYFSIEMIKLSDHIASHFRTLRDNIPSEMMKCSENITLDMMKFSQNIASPMLLEFFSLFYLTLEHSGFISRAVWNFLYFGYKYQLTPAHRHTCQPSSDLWTSKIHSKKLQNISKTHVCFFRR